MIKDIITTFENIIAKMVSFQAYVNQPDTFSNIDINVTEAFKSFSQHTIEWIENEYQEFDLNKSEMNLDRLKEDLQSVLSIPITLNEKDFLISSISQENQQEYHSYLHQQLGKNYPREYNASKYNYNGLINQVYEINNLALELLIKLKFIKNIKNIDFINILLEGTAKGLFELSCIEEEKTKNNYFKEYLSPHDVNQLFELREKYLESINNETTAYSSYQLIEFFKDNLDESIIKKLLEINNEYNISEERANALFLMQYTHKLLKKDHIFNTSYNINYDKYNKSNNVKNYFDYETLIDIEFILKDEIKECLNYKNIDKLIPCIHKLIEITPKRIVEKENALPIFIKDSIKEAIIAGNYNQQLALDNGVTINNSLQNDIYNFIAKNLKQINKDSYKFDINTFVDDLVELNNNGLNIYIDDLSDDTTNSYNPQNKDKNNVIKSKDKLSKLKALGKNIVLPAIKHAIILGLLEAYATIAPEAMLSIADLIDKLDLLLGETPDEFNSIIREIKSLNLPDIPIISFITKAICGKGKDIEK